MHKVDKITRIVQLVDLREAAATLVGKTKYAARRADSDLGDHAQAILDSIEDRIIKCASSPDFDS